MTRTYQMPTGIFEVCPTCDYYVRPGEQCRCTPIHIWISEDDGTWTCTHCCTDSTKCRRVLR